MFAVAAVVLLVAALAAAASLFERRPGGAEPAAGAQPSASGTPGVGGTALAGQGTTPTSGASPTSVPTSPSPTVTPSDPTEDDDDETAGTSGTSGNSGSGSGGGRAYTDRTGFSVVLPRGWRVSRDGTDVYVREPGTRAYLLIAQTTQPKDDALADWRAQERTAPTRFANYERIRLERVEYKGWDAADWEFTWQSSGAPQRVLNRNVRVSDRRAYALYWSVPANRWEELLPAFERVASSFRPAD